jgi:hypothetical protein
MAMMDQSRELVRIEDFFWNGGDGNFHVFVAFHVVVEIKILDVEAHEFCIGS